MHGAGAALRDAAAELGAGQADLLAERPQQRLSGSTSTSSVLPLMFKLRHL